MSTRRTTLLAIVMLPVVLMLTLASISLASAHPAATPTGHAIAKKKPQIVISSFAFTVPKKVKPGAKISVVNKDAVKHTVTADDGTSFAVDAPAHSTVVFKAPKTAGSYPFHCAIHTSMKSTLVVK